MLPKSEFLPNWTSPPGATIRDVLEERELSLEWFSDQMGLSLDQIANLLCGLTGIGPDLAQQLEKLFGAPAQFWLIREKRYRRDLVRLGLSSPVGFEPIQET